MWENSSLILDEKYDSFCLKQRYKEIICIKELESEEKNVVFNRQGKKKYSGRTIKIKTITIWTEQNPNIFYQV